MRSATYREAVGLALAEELSRDDSVWVLGEDIAAAGGVFKATDGLMSTFGPERVRDTPISEQAIVGCALGSAVTGLRPVVEIMFADFAGVCFDGLANQLAKYRYMSGGQASVPVTVRLINGAGLGFGSQHSQAVENWFLNIPGLKICVPGTPADLYGLLKAAVRDDDPVLVFEHKGLYGLKGELPEASDDVVTPLGQAEVVRTGGDVTIVATQLMRHRAVTAAEDLAQRGIEAEVIDLRTIAPLDVPAVIASLERTGRLVCAQEGPLAGGWASSLVTAVIAEAFDLLDAPPAVVCAESTPVPYSGTLETLWVPDAERIAAAAASACA
jgi:pyruvate dehydrogenase E1 component beta subunit